MTNLSFTMEENFQNNSNILAFFNADTSTLTTNVSDNSTYKSSILEQDKSAGPHAKFALRSKAHN